jgi:2-succinyl-6-hydroxy-2,4-cyclohexadiene-1-carboxylate synthase
MTRTLLLHGFTRDPRMWAPLAEGDAPDVVPRGSFFETVDALVPDAACGVIGYSMGARLALWLAARHPSKVRWLVLDGASLGLATQAERAGRREADEKWIALLETKGFDAFIEQWDAQPLFGGVKSPRPAQDPQVLAQTLRVLGKGAMPYLGGQLADVRCPVLLINGDRDTQGLSETERVAQELPHAQRVELPGHHAVHAESPERWRACVQTFLTPPWRQHDDVRLESR